MKSASHARLPKGHDCHGPDRPDDQIYKNFADSGIGVKQEEHAESGDHLKRLLKDDHRYVFTLIQKFSSERGQKYPMLSDRDDIIVITDEAHRSQYDTLALNMRNALPNAAFIAFTGTPLIVGEERTKEVFGEYISVYNFRQSIDDNATVPLYYENRIPELQLINENFSEEMTSLLEDAELNEEQEKKLEREFAREYHLITRKERLDRISKDIVQHFMGRGWAGKGMVVCIDKATAVRMYDKVKAEWKKEIALLITQMETCSEEDMPELGSRLNYMESTDMAVVVSQSQNEIDEFKRKELDIVPHRKRMVSEDLDTRFKDSADPLRLVFVCAMWMTGFDVPSCSTIYLDKPMKNHTLMQTIARANRVFGEKQCGLIVDYVGIFRNLQQALAIYGAGSGGDGGTPIESKDILLEALMKALEEARVFCHGLGVDLDKIVAIQDAFKRTAAKQDAVEAILVNDETRIRFLSMTNRAIRIFKALIPDQRANEHAPLCNLLGALVEWMRSEIGVADISGVMQQVEALLDRSIAAEGYVIRGNEPKVNLSEIDFEKLKKIFEKGRKRTEAEKLKMLLSAKVQTMVRLNRARIDYLERLQKLIDDYNTGSVNVEEFFRQLMNFAGDLNEEEKRGVKEGLTEEELTVFDLLMKPEITMSTKEQGQVKKVAQALLEKLRREKLVLDWRKRQQTRAAVRVAIEEELDQLPPVFIPAIFHQKCEQVYQHVYDAYWGEGRGVYDGE